MRFQFSHPVWLLALLPVVGWVVWLALKSFVQVSPWRRWTSMALRLVISVGVVLALAGLQWLRPMEGLNLFFLLDRSDSIPGAQQDKARVFVNESSALKKKVDRGGVIAFGAGASIESSPNLKVDLQKVLAVVGADRTDIGAAIRLGTAAFPEAGQKRLVLVSDGNQNIGDALNAVTAARALGVTMDVLPVGIARSGDVSIQRLSLPTRIKKGQTFEVKVFAQSDKERQAKLRLFRNSELLGEQTVDLGQGKNLFTFPQTLRDTGFYDYDVQLDAPGDTVPQNNRASGFANVQGDPRVLIVSGQPDQDTALAAALQSSRIESQLVGVQDFPSTLPAMQSYDAIFLSNVAAGDLGPDLMRLLESAVRDFGVGLVCVGGDQTYAAGGYRGTPLESTLPVDMELNSKKVMPGGAVVLIMHGMEFNNGNKVAQQCAMGVLDALGPQDEMGVVLWDGNNHWLFPLDKVGDKKEMGRKIAGMNQGDLPTFQEVMEMAYKGDAKTPGLKQAKASLKHIIVFSDGDPGAPTPELMQSIVGDKITVSTVMISGHSGPDRMIRIADQGNGRFYDVSDPEKLPQIFIKEAMVILKSAISEEPFRPQLASGTELVRGIAGNEFPVLKGYVCATPKARAEVALVSDKGDPVLAHWQYGLGRAVAFTSDARAKWASEWLGWPKYRQFWSQVAQWALRKVENADFQTELAVENGEGILSVEALDPEGNYRNFLNLQAAVVGPKAQRQTVRLQQTGPGRYEVRFPTRDVGAYIVNLMELKDGKLSAWQTLGSSVNYSPEFQTTGPNQPLLEQLASVGGGQVLSFGDGGDPKKNSYLRDRQKTFQPNDLWEWILKISVLLFVLDVGVRRIYIDQSEWAQATRTLQRWVFFWRKPVTVQESDESLGSLLARRDQVRARRTGAAVEAKAELFRPAQPVGDILPDSAGGKTVPKAPATEDSSAAAGAGSGSGSKPAAPLPASTDRLLDAKRRASKKLRK